MFIKLCTGTGGGYDIFNPAAYSDNARAAGEKAPGNNRRYRGKIRINPQFQRFEGAFRGDEGEDRQNLRFYNHGKVRR